MPSQPTFFTRIIDKTVAALAPETGIRRMAARQFLTQFDYDGVKRDGRRGTIGGSLYRNASPESDRISMDAVNLMWESRDMEQNFCLWRGTLTRTVQYAFPVIRWQSRTGDSEIDAEHEAYWEDWCKRADLTQRHHLNTIVRLGMRSMLRDRDFGLALEDVEGDLRVRGIEADRIGDPTNPPPGSDRNKVHGIQLGEHGEPVLYEIYKRLRSNQYEKEVELPPERFLHVFDPLRIDQYRGVCWGAPALPHMRDLYEALGAEMSAIKFAASYSGFVQSETPFADHAAGQFGDTKNVNGKDVPTLEAQAGKVQRLNKGESIIFAPGAQRPSGAFMAWFEAKVREIAVGLNVPFGFVWNLALLGGVTARIEVAQMKRTLDWLREIAKDKMLEPLKDKVLRRGIAKREIRPHANRGKGRWSFGADITGDVGHDTNADIALLSAGIFSESMLIEGKFGGDFEEHVYAQAREMEIRQRVAGETGVPVELQSQRYQQATPLLAAMNSRGDPSAEQPVLDQAAPEQMTNEGMPNAEGMPPAPAGLAAAHGKDAVKGLIEVMKRLNLGEITRDMAVQILVATYGLDLADADAMVP